MALNLGGSQTLEIAGDKLFISNDRELVGRVSRPGVAKPPTGKAVVAELVQTLVHADLQPVAVLDAHAKISASMPPAATIAGAADVRTNPGSDGKSLVLDFHGLRTISEVSAPSGTTINGVYAWLGTKFDEKVVKGFPVNGGTVAPFNELQAERLLVTLDGVISADAFASGGTVVFPTPPADLEVLVNGTRAFFKKGPYDGSLLPQIDLTAAVAAAAAAGGDVTVTFHAAAPASLTLEATASLLQRYAVRFPEPPTADAPTEVVYPLSLPVQASAFTAPRWYVRRAILDVSAKLPPTRVIPADGPPLTDDAELVVDPDHAIVVQLPTSATGSLGTLNGVRLPVVVEASGAELAGTLVAPAADGGPGDPIAKAALGPVTLQAGGTADDPMWIDLALTAPHPLNVGDVVWLEVQAARGSVHWQLATPPADDADAAPLRRRTSNGRYVSLSTVSELPYTGALRVVGQERPNDPVAAVLVSASGAGASGSVAGVPAPGGTTLGLVLDPPVQLERPQANAGDATFSLDLTISAPGSYAITSAELQYTTTQ